MDSLEDDNSDYQRDIENETAPLSKINVIDSYNHYKKRKVLLNIINVI